MKLLGRKELIYSVNELIAVIDEEAAKPYIQKIHKGMISQLTNFRSDIIEKSIDDLSQNRYIRSLARSVYEGRPDAAYIAKSNELTPPDNVRTSLNLRKYITEVTSDPVKYIDFHKREDETHGEVIKRLRAQVRSQTGIFQWLFAKADYNKAKQMLALDDDGFIAVHMKKERSFYLMFLVLCTTGPLGMTDSLFNSLIVTRDFIDDEVKKMTFRHYGLDKEFAVCIQIPLHASLWDIFSFLNKDVGIESDASWLPEGVSNIEAKEKLLRARQKELESTLADELADFKNKIESYRDTLQKRQNSWFGIFFRGRRQLQINALNEALQCFDNEENTFDIVQLQNVLDEIKPHEKLIFAEFFSGNMKQLIKGLEKLCREAVVLGVTKDKKPKFNNDEVQIQSPMTKLLTSTPLQLTDSKTHSSGLTSNSHLVSEIKEQPGSDPLVERNEHDELGTSIQPGI